MNPVEYKCVFCVDQYLTDSDERPFAKTVRDAVTLVPFTQVHSPGAFGQQSVVNVVAVPCCLECRKTQVTASSGKLLRA